MHLKFNNQFNKIVKLFIVFSGFNSLHSNELSKYCKYSFFDHSEIKELLPLFYISQVDKLATQINPTNPNPKIEDTIANLKRNYDNEFVKFIIRNNLNVEPPILTDIKHEGQSLCRPYSYLLIVRNKQSMKAPVIKNLTTFQAIRLCEPESYLLYIAVYNFLEKLKELVRKTNTPEATQVKNEETKKIKDRATKRIEDREKISKKLNKERKDTLNELEDELDAILEAKFIKDQINFLYLLRRGAPNKIFRKRFLIPTIIEYFAHMLGYHLACFDCKIEYFGRVENIEKIDPLVRQALRDLIIQEVEQIFAKEEDNPNSGAWMVNYGLINFKG